MHIFCEECGVCWCGIACEGREIGYCLFHETGILVQRVFVSKLVLVPCCFSVHCLHPQCQLQV
jgi:hypothetical protein